MITTLAVIYGVLTVSSPICETEMGSFVLCSGTSVPPDLGARCLNRIPKSKSDLVPLEHMTSEMSPKGLPIDLYCGLLIFLTIVTKYAQFYSQQTLWGIAGGGVDRAGPVKG